MHIKVWYALFWSSYILSIYTHMHTLLAILKFFCILSHLPDVFPSIPEEKTSSSVPKLSFLYTWVLDSFNLYLRTLIPCLFVSNVIVKYGYRELNCTYISCMSNIYYSAIQSRHIKFTGVSFLCLFQIRCFPI